MDHKALFSVPIHKELEYFAKTLTRAGWIIISTSEVSSFLKDKGIKTVDVSDFVGINKNFGFPPTLHPKMEAALTTNNPDAIDLVYDIPYNLETGNDVGGHTLLALAAKGNKIAVMEPEDMRKVVDSITRCGKIKPEFRDYLNSKANFEISKHYLQLASENNHFSGVVGKYHSELLNGENIYQVPAGLFTSGTDDKLAITNFKQVAGENPCFTNIADLDSILETICKLQGSLKLNGINKCFIVIAAKHGNPCGIGVNLEDPAKAINAALWGNAKGIWGGEVITNFALDSTLAQMLVKSQEREKLLGNKIWMLDVVAAPAVSNEAIKVIATSPRRKIFVNSSLSSPFLCKDKNVLRPVRGGFLSQPPADYLLDLEKIEWVSKPSINKIDLIISWAAAFTSFHGGNEVAIAKNNQLLSVGGGPSTFDAANTAIIRSRENGHDVKDSVFGADAFFPFTDVPEILCNAGCVAGTVPGGGKREKDVLTYFKDKKVAVGIIPEEYRGFCRH